VQGPSFGSCVCTYPYWGERCQHPLDARNCTKVCPEGEKCWWDLKTDTVGLDPTDYAMLCEGAPTSDGKGAGDEEERKETEKLMISIAAACGVMLVLILGWCACCRKRGVYGRVERPSILRESILGASLMPDRQLTSKVSAGSALPTLAVAAAADFRVAVVGLSSSSACFVQDIGPRWSAAHAAEQQQLASSVEAIGFDSREGGSSRGSSDLSASIVLATESRRKRKGGR
jgi:hypothetical protein